MSSPNQQPIAPNNNDEIISNEPVAKHRLSEEEEVLNPASLAFFSWVSPMLARGWKKFQAGELLEDADLMRLPRDESASNSYSVFNALYKDWKADVQGKMKLAGEAAAIADPNKNREPAGSSDVQEDEDPEIATQKRIAAAILAAESELHNPMKILGLMVRASRRDVLLGCFFRLFQDGSSIASPFVLRALIKWLAEYAVFGSEGGITKWEGFVYGIVLAILSFLMWVFTNLSLFYTNKAFSRMRAAFAMAVYEKTLKLDRSQLANVGRIQQMHSSDTYKFVDMSLFINTIWAAPLVIIGALIALYFFVGWAGLLSLATLILISPSQGVIMKGMMMVRIATAGIADERIQAVNEFCQGIRIIKFMGWEPSTIKNILAIRTKEVARFSESNFYRSSLLTVMFSTSLLISLVVFAVAYAIGHPVSLENVFPAIAMINVLRQPLTQLPIGIARIVDCNVGLKRICEYLCLEEKKTYIKPFATAEEESVNAAVLENVTAIYEVGGDTDPMKKKEVAGRGGAGGRGGRGGRGGGRGGRGGSGAPSPASPKADGSPASPADGPVAPVERVFRPFMGPISVALPRKKLTIVIGPTGSGKSTLLDMVIGEALVDRRDEGAFRVSSALGDVAYMTQEAWIMNATLKNNILMGTAHDDARYVETVNACQLIADLEQLAGSDQTEIGERGINLSGGQKQRVAFARAVYSGRSVVLMDDPLSAVDSHVCTALFRQCIQGVMRDRTRVLVTHAIQFLPEADHIIVVDRCAIAFQGTYDELLQSSIDPALYTVGAGSPTPGGGSPKNQQNENDAIEGVVLGRDEDLTPTDTVMRPIPEPKKKEASAGGDGALMSKEHQETGGIKLETLQWYVRQQGVGWFVLTMVCFGVAQAVNVAAQLILSWWTAKTTLVGQKVSDEQYIQWYGIFIAASIATLFLQTIPFNKTMLNCARDCHEWMLRSVIRCPTSYFDTTPTGRIISRFSKDLDNMDQQIPWTLGTTYQLIFQIIGSIGIMTYSVQYLLIMWAVTLVFFFLLFKYYGATNRAQKRLEAVNRTPMAAIMNETLGGISTVRAYGMIPFYQAKHEMACDLSSCSTYSWRLSQRWLSVRIQGVGALVILTAALVFCGVIVSMDRQDAIQNLPVMSLSLTNAIAMATFLGILTNLSSELESAMSSVERVKEFCNELPQERDIIYDHDEQNHNNAHHELLPHKGNEGQQQVHARFANQNTTLAPPLPVGWPLSGELRFDHASLRYRSGLPLVLKDLNLTVSSGAKVGVVGRTGSGKSTLMLALFRILETTELTLAESEELSPKDELNFSKGSILLDGRDIATIQLQDLRSAITIIPQDPLLFAGTVRSNVDPFSQHSDERVWAVVGQVGLQERVLAATAVASTDDVAALQAMSAERVATALACPVAARGANFSVGQRQLLCLARALLKKCTLLLLDEATASVDQDTDNKIQRTIRESFAHCTVLTIAHRLQTIMDSDRVLVMEHGVAVEYDAPFTLLGKPKGAGATFRGMVEALGEEQAAVMYEIAERKFYK